MDCPFCKILTQNKDRIIRKTKFCFVVLSDPRLMPGHTLVIPKRHVEKFSELTKQERNDLFNEVIILQEKILKDIAPGCDICEHYRPFIINNILKVSHLHIHLRPRFLKDKLYEKVQINENDVFQKLPDEELKKYRKLLSQDDKKA